MKHQQFEARKLFESVSTKGKTYFTQCMCKRSSVYRMARAEILPIDTELSGLFVPPFALLSVHLPLSCVI